MTWIREPESARVAGMEALLASQQREMHRMLTAEFVGATLGLGAVLVMMFAWPTMDPSTGLALGLACGLGGMFVGLAVSGPWHRWAERRRPPEPERAVYTTEIADTGDGDVYADAIRRRLAERPRRDGA